MNIIAVTSFPAMRNMVEQWFYMMKWMDTGINDCLKDH